MANNKGHSKGCQRCRKLKMKCSQDRPTCQRCQKAGHDCVYQASFDRLHRDQNTAVELTATKKWRQRARVQLQNEPPHSMYDSLYTQACRRFCYDFVTPLPSTMGDLPGLTSTAPSDSCIGSAVAAVAYANFAARSGFPEACDAGRIYYGRTLQKLATLMTHPVEMQQKGVLPVIFLLALYEMHTSAVRDGSWVTHMQGTQSIVAHRDSIHCKDDDKYLFILCMHLLVYYFNENKAPPLHFDDWIQKIPFLFEHKRQLAILMLKAIRVSLQLRADDVATSSITSEVLQSAVRLDFQLEKWALELVYPWSSMTKHPLSRQDIPEWTRDFFDHPGAPQYMMCYPGILAAADSNIYRATRIRLNMALLDFISKFPSPFLETQMLKARVAQRLSTLTEEIASVLPYSLFLSADGSSDPRSAKEVPGLKAYIQLWPIITGHVCCRRNLAEDAESISREKWFRRVLCYLRDSMGVAKVQALLDETSTV